MEFEVAYTFENEQQFWDELDDTISKDYQTHTLIDNALRSYLSLTTNFRGEYINSDYDVARCSYKLYSSPLFQNHGDYIRRQIVHCLLEDDEPNVLRVAASFLLADARQNEPTFELMNNEGIFRRLIDLISDDKKQDEEAEVHRLLMELLYEMSRIQKITAEDLLYVKDEFVKHLFDIIEQLSDDVHDPYHYPVIRVLLVLNEQFMVSAHEPVSPEISTLPLTNKVIKVLASHGSNYKSFGENIILLLNREDETSLQLLTLKLLYLLFTTPSTYEYFYTNDLRVLVDILIRNLLDLPEDAAALRHTYLRVLYPLLAHTQLRQPPHYKRDEIRKLLSVLARGQPADADLPGNAQMSASWGHFEEVDDTTKRLVTRCQKVTWLADPELESSDQTGSPTDERSEPGSPPSPVKSKPPALPAPRKLTKRKTSETSALPSGPYLRPQLESARQSSLSMMEMAVQREKPGVITPSRNPALKEGLRAAIFSKKEKPPPPVARRSAWSRRSHDTTAEKSTKGSPQNIEKGGEGAEAAKPSSPKLERPTLSSTPSEIITVTKTTAPEQKKPPPAPKSRRWRGKSKHDTEEGGRKPTDREPGKFNPSLPSIVTTPASETKKADISPFSPVEDKSLAMSPPPPDDQPRASVKDALGEAQAEAISGIRETLERANLGPDTLSEAPPVTPQVTPPKGVLAPPGHVQRGVPGPRFELERSPFLSDQEEVSEEDEWNDAPDTKEGE